MSNIWHRPPKTLGSFWVIGEFFAVYNKPLLTTPEFMLMRWVRVGPYIASEQGLVTRETNHMIWKFLLSSSWRTSGEKNKLEIKFTHQWPLTQSIMPITWNVRGTHLRKRRRSKLWTVKWQQGHNYQQLNLKQKQKQTQQTTRTGTESQKWRSYRWLSAGSGWRESGEKVQGIGSIIARHKIDREGVKNSVGNVEAEELICTTHGQELRWGECWREGECRVEGNKGGRNGTTTIA